MVQGQLLISLVLAVTRWRPGTGEINKQGRYAMATLGHFYKGHLIWRDATGWVVRVAAWGDEADREPRFKTLTAARAYIDRNQGRSSPSTSTSRTGGAG